MAFIKMLMYYGVVANGKYIFHPLSSYMITFFLLFLLSLPFAFCTGISLVCDCRHKKQDVGTEVWVTHDC